MKLFVLLFDGDAYTRPEIKGVFDSKKKAKEQLIKCVNKWHFSCNITEYDYTIEEVILNEEV